MFLVHMIAPRALRIQATWHHDPGRSLGMLGLDDLAPGHVVDVRIEDVDEALRVEGGTIQVLVNMGVEAHSLQLSQT